MHCRHGCAQLPIGEREEPADSFRFFLCHMQPEQLDQHHLREVLAEEHTSRLRVPQHHNHAFQIPLHDGTIGMTPDMHKRWQQTQQDARVFSGESKESCETQTRSTALPRNNASIQWPSNDRSDVDRGDSEVACEAERLPVRQRHKISPFQPYSLIDTFD